MLNLVFYQLPLCIAFDLLLQCVRLSLATIIVLASPCSTASTISKLLLNEDPSNKLDPTTFLSRPLFLLRSPRQPLFLIRIPLLLCFPHLRCFVFVFFFYLLFLDRNRLFHCVPALGVSVFSSVTLGRCTHCSTTLSPSLLSLTVSPISRFIVLVLASLNASKSSMIPPYVLSLR